MRRKKSRSYELTIESLSHEGRGVSHIDGKTIFVSNAPGKASENEGHPVPLLYLAVDAKSLFPQLAQ